ncbi:MAG: hypothetical protein IIA88_06590 [Bacteroidetes bacterium]|nr:hypothetical protein [Bacteroidota bacterium]
MLGKKIQTLANEIQKNGQWTLNFSAKDLEYGGGVYILKLSFGVSVYTRQLVEC